MGLWHPQFNAREVHNSRRESWNDSNPSVSVELSVTPSDLYPFVRELVYDRQAWPYNDVGPFEVYVSDVEILPIASKYVSDRGADESLTAPVGNERKIRVTYRPNIARLHTIVTSIGTGTATDYGFESQAVWVEIIRTMETQFLTMDFLDFQWKDGKNTPLKSPDEAPGHVYRTVKYDILYKNVFLTQDLEWIIYNYSSTVNDSSLTDQYRLQTFLQDQVLFNVEEVKPTLRTQHHVLPTPPGFILYDLRCSFHARLGESTWNKYWRATINETEGVDDSGWYEMQLRPTANTPAIDFQPYQRTTFWYPLWVS